MLQPFSHSGLLYCFRLIRELFEYTRDQAECSVIFIDEVDSICRQRTSREQDLTRRWVTTTYFKFVGFKVHVSMTTQSNIFWDVRLCNFVQVYLQFGGIYCLHLQVHKASKPFIRKKFLMRHM